MVLNSKRFGITTQNKKPSMLKQFIFIVLMVIVGIAIAVAVQEVIREQINNLKVTDDLNAAWSGSLASYWGAILGGVISGCLTLVGVTWTIKYYKNSEAAKTRETHMPFLKMDELCRFEDVADIPDLNDSKIYMIKEFESSDKQKQHSTFYYKMKLQNIGQGFASTLVIYTGENIGGVAYSELIQVNDNKEVFFGFELLDKLYTGVVEVPIQYIDCMTNEYIQEYSVWIKNGKIERIISGYPQFLAQTHDIINNTYKKEVSITLSAD